MTQPGELPRRETRIRHNRTELTGTIKSGFGITQSNGDVTYAVYLDEPIPPEQRCLFRHTAIGRHAAVTVDEITILYHPA